MKREDVFIANVLKCRPPGNRDPQPEEIDSCRPWLEEQVRLIEPRVIGTLGNFATKLLTGSPTGITKVRGTAQHHTLGGRPVLLLPLFHPGRRAAHPAGRRAAARGLRADPGPARRAAARPRARARARVRARRRDEDQPGRSRSARPDGPVRLGRSERAGVGSAVPHPLRHLGEIARSAATKRRQQRDDASALRELAADPLQLPAGLGIEWLGVSGYRLSYEGKDLYIDPYVSRVPLSSLLLRRPGGAGPGRARSLPAREGRGGRRAGRAHALRPRGGRAGGREAVRLQGLRLQLAGAPDVAARAARSMRSRSSPTRPMSWGRSRSSSSPAPTRSCCWGWPCPTPAS